MIKRYLTAFFLLLLTVTVFAANSDSAPSTNEFDAVTANKVLARLNSNTNSKQELQKTITSLTQLNVQAKKCVADTTAELDDISKSLGPVTTPAAPGTSLTLTADQKYLNQKKADLSDQLSDCRLFILRSDEAINNLGVKLRSVVKTQLLYQDTNVFSNISHLPVDLNNFYKVFNFPLLTQLSGITLFTPILGGIILLCLLVSILIGLKLRTWIGRAITNEPVEYFSTRLKQAALSVLHRYIVFLLPVVILILFFNVIISLPEPSELALISIAVFIYLIFMMLVRFFFYPPKPAQGFSTLAEHLAKSLVHRLNFLGVLALIAYIIHVSFTQQDIPDSLNDLLRTIFITILTINFISVIWLVTRLPKFTYRYNVISLLINIFLSMLLLIILFAEWFGYHLLATYLLHGLIITVVSIFVLRIIHKLCNVILTELNGTQRDWQQKFRRSFGIKNNEQLPELLWLRFVIYAVIWSSFVLFFLKIWGLAPTNFQLLLNTLLHGFQIGEINIVPSHIVWGVFFFAIFAASTRLLRTYIVQNANMQLDKGNRESLAAIAGYIGFAIAFLIGLLIAGVNFSGLAIIAGALSVGIGFGLQNIVNNFVSGIILLIERPIKPGDRIIVGDTEGYVRHISIRSTHIITLRRSDVIVPNSDLISKQVTNYMLYDINYKISTKVGLAYGSDIELAKKLLLEIANNHPNVIKNKPGQEPSVLFNSFGDNNLDFELYCLVDDVELKGQVVSDLNFAIDKAFRENGIEIAFPQRELIIKNWPGIAGSTI